MSDYRPPKVEPFKEHVAAARFYAKHPEFLHPSSLSTQRVLKKSSMALPSSLGSSSLTSQFSSLSVSTDSSSEEAESGRWNGRHERFFTQGFDMASSQEPASSSSSNVFVNAESSETDSFQTSVSPSPRCSSPIHKVLPNEARAHAYELPATPPPTPSSPQCQAAFFHKNDPLLSQHSKLEELLNLVGLPEPYDTCLPYSGADLYDMNYESEVDDDDDDFVACGLSSFYRIAAEMKAKKARDAEERQQFLKRMEAVAMKSSK